MIALQLSKAGYFTLDNFDKIPANFIINALYYEDFLNKYEKEYLNINNKEG